MMGSALLLASRSPRLRRLCAGSGATRRVVDRFVAGEQLDQALAAATGLARAGLLVTLDHLGEDVTSTAAASAARDAYLLAAEAIGTAGVGGQVELSLKLSSFGQALPGGHDLALAHVESVAAAARDARTTITLDMEGSATVDSTLAIWQALHRRYVDIGVAVQAYLHRTVDDLARLSEAGARVRLVKGAYREPAAIAWQRSADVDAAFRRCLTTLMAGPGYPMVATHDPAMITAARQLAASSGRGADRFELQMLYGMRTAEQLRLVREGLRCRTYLPYGVDWYPYFMRRLAERPANVTFFLRGLAARS